MKTGKNIRIYIDMDDVLCDFTSAYKNMRIKYPEIKYPQSQYGFFRNLKPMERAVNTFKMLSNTFDVWILTAPSTYNPMSYTEKREWVENHLGFDVCEKLIISPDKSLLKGSYLIDDLASGRAKQDKFEGDLIVFGQEPYENWGKVYDYFKERFDNLL